MKPIVRLREAAEQDLLAAAEWYEQQRPGLGHQFLDEVRSSLNLIAGNPLAYPAVHRGTRRALMRRFPFGIYFQPEVAGVVVTAVMHASRHPGRWQQRP
jgi:plasmid stabilization system protein ParE